MKETVPMKSRILVLVGLVALLGSSVTFGTPAQGGVLGAKKHQDHDHGHERHPELVKAIRQLREVRASLAAAARDYGGHRAKAVEITDRAIREVQAAMDYDRH
jgi:hypothetical protein